MQYSFINYNYVAGYILMIYLSLEVCTFSFPLPILPTSHPHL